jgi:integrase
MSPSTINRDLAILRCLLRLAKRWGYVREVPRFELAKEPQGRLRYLERAEATRLLDACRESGNGFLHAIVTVALHTRMRFGEIMGLTWDRVDFSRGVVVLVETKGGEPRDVPMDEAVYTALSARRAAAGPAPTGLVFCKADETGWGSVRTAFAVALRRAKITGFRFHDLRHTCASWLVMDGASLMEVEELLGHKTLAMTLRYAHLAPGRLREAVGRLDRVFAPEAVAAQQTFSSGDRVGVASPSNPR